MKTIRLMMISLAALVNGYRSTDAAISTMVKKDFEKDLFKKADR